MLKMPQSSYRQNVTKTGAGQNHFLPGLAFKSGYLRPSIFSHDQPDRHTPRQNPGPTSFPDDLWAVKCDVSCHHVFGGLPEKSGGKQPPPLIS